MDIQEALKWADDLVFARTGKRLDSLQRAILEGTWQRQTYADVAQKYHCSPDHAKRVASDLWKLLSDALGEDVRKSNVRAILEGVVFSKISNFGADMQIHGNINVFSEHCSHANAAKKPSATTANPENRYDLTEAPKKNRFYNRTQELATLKQWILEENIAIVTLVGLSGIGKSAIALQLVEEIKDKCDRIIWRNCNHATTLTSLKTDMIQFLSPQAEINISSFIDCWRSRRALIILDNFQEIFAPGELAGTYLAGRENYGDFLKEIAAANGDNCLLLLSWEKPKEISTLEARKSLCRTLQIPGLGESATEILKERELIDEDRWLELIEIYSGNPLWLNIAANTILELFDGGADRFLSSATPFLGDLESILQEHYRRLSELEKQVIFLLASQEEAVDISRLPPDFPLSDADFWKGLQSLQKRCLVEKVKERGGRVGDATSLFRLQPVVKEYVKGTSQF